LSGETLCKGLSPEPPSVLLHQQQDYHFTDFTLARLGALSTSSVYMLFAPMQSPHLEDDAPPEPFLKASGQEWPVHRKYRAGIPARRSLASDFRSRIWSDAPPEP